MSTGETQLEHVLKRGEKINVYKHLGALTLQGHDLFAAQKLLCRLCVVIKKVHSFRLKLKNG